MLRKGSKAERPTPSITPARSKENKTIALCTG